MTSFEPIIGSGFDALAGQRQFWNQFNRGTETDNMARAAQAQQVQNNWLAQVAALRQQAMDRDAQAQQNADAQAQQAAANAQAATESRREFDVNTGLSKEQLANQNAQFKFKQGETNKQEGDALAEIQNIGKSSGPEAAKVGQSFEKAQKDYADAQNEVAIFAQELANKDLKGVPVTYNPKSNMFVSKFGNIPDQYVAKVAAANKDLAERLGETSQTGVALAQAREDMKRMNTLAGNNFIFQKRGDKWGLYAHHPKIDKFFTDESYQGSGPDVNPDAGADYRPGGANPLPIPSAALTQSVPAAPAVAFAASTPTVTTRAAFDALPSGAIYLGQDGRRYRKP